jgi:hypothetical protein
LAYINGEDGGLIAQETQLADPGNYPPQYQAPCFIGGRDMGCLARAKFKREENAQNPISERSDERITREDD